MAREDDLEREELLRQLGGPAPQGGPVGSPIPDVVGPASPVMTPASGLPSREQRDTLVYSRPAAGFNSGDYGGDVKARTSMKNTWAKGVQQWDQTPESFTPEELAQFLQSDFARQYFPNARLVEGGAGDKVDFGGQLSDYESGVPVGIVDVIGAAAPGQGSLAWMDEANDGGAGPAGGGGMDLASLIGQGEDLTSGDRLQQILAAIDALSRGEDPTRDALLAELA